MLHLSFLHILIFFFFFSDRHIPVLTLSGHSSVPVSLEFVRPFMPLLPSCCLMSLAFLKWLVGTLASLVQGTMERKWIGPVEVLQADKGKSRLWTEERAIYFNCLSCLGWWGLLLWRDIRIPPLYLAQKKGRGHWKNKCPKQLAAVLWSGPSPP